MHEVDCTLWFSIGLAIGSMAPTFAKAILERLGGRAKVTLEGPKDVTVVLPGETLHRISDTVSTTILDAIEAHIKDWKKPSAN